MQRLQSRHSPRSPLERSERAAITAREQHAPTSSEPAALARAARPFLKWAGGKRQLLHELIARSPRRIETYHEPFLGGGAVFFALFADPALAPKRAVLNDLNHELVTTYTVVRDDVRGLTERLSEMQSAYLGADDRGRAERFYAERDRQPTEPLEVAARLIFLNKTCYNGLYRVNRRGRFNVPHGRYRSPNIADCEALIAASAALQCAELTVGDFEAASKAAQPGDFVYFDPPFHPLSPTSSFTGYTEGSFDRPAQLRLKTVIDDLDDRGVRMMLSNSPHDWIVGVYEGAQRYHLDTTPARRAINSRGDRRGAINELIVTNYPEEEARGHLESA